MPYQTSHVDGSVVYSVAVDISPRTATISRSRFPLAADISSLAHSALFLHIMRPSVSLKNAGGRSD